MKVLCSMFVLQTALMSLRRAKLELCLLFTLCQGRSLWYWSVFLLCVFTLELILCEHRGTEWASCNIFFTENMWVFQYPRSVNAARWCLKRVQSYTNQILNQGCFHGVIWFEPLDFWVLSRTNSECDWCQRLQSGAMGQIGCGLNSWSQHRSNRTTGFFIATIKPTDG